MKKHQLLISLLTVGVCTSSFAESQIDISGEGRVRWEQKDNMDFNKDSDDATGGTASRFRVDISASPNDKVNVFFQPQFTKTWGAQDSLSNNTSGALNDTELDVHQAYLNYQLTEHMSSTIGRQELAYGDHVVVGNVGWSNVGRSFDGIKLRNQYNFGWADVFMSNVRDDSSSTANDRTFSGIYTQFKDTVPFINEADLYLMYEENMASENFASYGTRLKRVHDLYDVTFEATFQNGPTNYDGSQMRLEAGYKLSGYRLFAGYLTADKNYQQLYPTGHKFLGIADLFSRRNITGFRLGGSGKLMEKLSFKIEYLVLSRAEETAPAYNFGGSNIGTGAEAGTALANELDLTIKYQFNEFAYFSAGLANVAPGDYLKNARGEDAGLYTFIQTGATF